MNELFVATGRAKPNEFYETFKYQSTYTISISFCFFTLADEEGVGNASSALEPEECAELVDSCLCCFNIMYTHYSAVMTFELPFANKSL